MSEIFVFGSNLGGYHGAGSALHARQHYGAKMGVGFGPTGQAYAIPTKAKNIIETLPLHIISGYVRDFIDYANDNPDLTFRVVAIGTGLAGYTHEQIAPLFKDAPDNCILPGPWIPYTRPNTIQ